MLCVETTKGTCSPQKTHEQVLRPRSDIQEFEDHYIIAVELPGIPAEDVHLEIEKSHLRVSAEQAKSSTSEKVIHCERLHGTFSRLFHLGDTVDRDGITAKTADGVLTIRLPKSTKALPRKIEVQS